MFEKNLVNYKLIIKITILLLCSCCLQLINGQTSRAIIIQEDFNNFKCFEKHETAKYRNLFNPGYGKPVGIQVSERVTHQLISRIYGIFLKEIIEYDNVTLISIELDGGSTVKITDEIHKMFMTTKRIAESENDPQMPIIDLEVWTYPDVRLLPSQIVEAGPVTEAGRFGWFVPNFQGQDNVEIPDEQLQYGIFTDQRNIFYSNYVIDNKILFEMEKKFGFEQSFVSSRCNHTNCVTLLAEKHFDTASIAYQIELEQSYKFFVNIIWLGKNYKNAINWLHKLYALKEYRNHNKRYLLLHWTPSDIIDAEITYDSITMPKCEHFTTAHITLCKYEMIPILKYYPMNFRFLRNKALFDFNMHKASLSSLLIQVNEKQSKNNSISSQDMKNYYNVLACKWLKTHPDRLNEWIEKQQINVTIGGIFPLNGVNNVAYKNITQVVKMASKAINNHPLSPNFYLNVHLADGQCRADTVMKSFIHYFQVIDSPVIGILGPACSETVEPIAGVSKHTRMAVISYSAEGALFTDRETYPYFFRTIGSNRQYEKVYLDLFKYFGWRRIAALTEDGQKYTEYISHMEVMMKQEDMELMSKKFPKDVSKQQMRRLLVELKNKHTKIIIADIYNDNARLVLCEAYQLEMTAKNGYVWFLPLWLSKTWNNGSQFISSTSKNIPIEDGCKPEHIFEMLNGHFSLAHAAFADNSSIIQYENRTVGEWLHEYNLPEISDYAGFVYDAIWVYALAADKLLKKEPTALSNLRTQEVIKQFVDIIWKTDFVGLSGRIRFDEGGSRVNNVSVMQWRNWKFNLAGQYIPEIDDTNEKIRIVGGKLYLNRSSIQWFTDEQPKDGTFDCNMAGLAEFLQVDCETATFVLTTVLCFISVVLISLASFIFWKRQYDKKLKQSAKVMKLYGIDLLSTNATNYTLDKWEVPKDKVVLNRRLGEGAFGTVFGGEAKLSDNGWTAVAVKSLKSGSSTEDRLDFLCEAEAMKLLDHNNIVKLLGVVLQSDPILTIMEFMLYGDLKTFLLARRHLVDEKVTDDSDVSPKRLTLYAVDIARGLSYLAEKKVVHRDIASRNCLVNAQRVAKVGDFGMARLFSDNDYYRLSRKGKLPVRWMSPEALTLGVFSSASDVWSFGVFLYEIITFGSFPFQGLTNKEVLEKVKEGKTIEIPTGVKPQLEALMKACWSRESKKRPTASEIVEWITNYPRLLTPCLDGPLSSLMVETESDEMELLPGLRKRLSTKPEDDMKPEGEDDEEPCKQNNLNESFLKKSEDQHSLTQNEKQLKQENINSPSSSTSGSISDNVNPTVCNFNLNEDNSESYYSPMTPLLRMNSELSYGSDSSQQYVPMYSVSNRSNDSSISSNNQNNDGNVKFLKTESNNNNCSRMESVKIIG